MVKARTLWPGVESPPAPTGQGAEHPVYPCQSNCISSPDCHLLNDPSNKGVGNLSQPLPDESDEYLAHRRTQEMMRNALIRLIGTLELDALIYPFSLKGPRKWINRSLKGMEETALAAHTRLPAIVVPAGYISGDGPIALGFIGKPFSDLTLLQAAHLYESHYPIRREPNLTWWRDAEETLGR